MQDPHINPETGVWDDNYFAKAQGGGSSGANTAGSFNPQAYDDLLKNLPKATDLVQGVNTGENNAFNDYLKYLGTQDNPLSFFTKATEAAGLPQMRTTAKSLQEQIYNTEDALRRIEGDVLATTKNSLVTDAQRRGITQAKAKPMQENLGWQSQSLGRVSDAIAKTEQTALNLTGLNEQGVARMTDAYKTKLDLASRQGDRAIQAMLTDMENTLNVTLAKIHRGEQVSDQEAANAFALFKAQKDYEMQKQGGQELMTIGEGTSIFDPNTGKVLYTAPKTYKGEGGGGGGTEDFYNNSGTPDSDSEWEPLQFNNILEYNKWLTAQ